MTDGLRQGLSVAQRAQARLRLGDDWQLVVAVGNELFLFFEILR